MVLLQVGYYLMGEYYYLVLSLAGISPADNNTLPWGYYLLILQAILHYLVPILGANLLW